MSAHPLAETIQTGGCSVLLRRVTGPEARELFVAVQPPPGPLDAGAQAEAVYRAILDVLEAEGAGFDSVVCETLFVREIGTDLSALRAARSQVLEARGGGPHRPATTEIEQPPLNERACLEISVHAVLPTDTSKPSIETFQARPECSCDECARSQGVRLQVGAETRFHAGGLCGLGDDAYQQTLDMFGVAEGLLERAGMAFENVVRTWIHLRDIDRDYADFNRARRAFFEARGVDPVPASTGIGGGPVSGRHDVCLAFYAVKAAGPPTRTVMTSPTLNEAPVYGADFVRGMRMVESNKIALHVSGTASIDETGRTAHPGDFAAQADRMLVNLAALLEGQGADFDDVVSAVTYLKHPSDAPQLRAKLREAGFEGFPNVLVAANVCRPELLCEAEVLAVLPRVVPSRSGGN